jgi:hypothetical protein
MPDLREITPGHFAACIRVDGYNKDKEVIDPDSKN